jgi:cytochrome c oxidase subunit I
MTKVEFPRNTPPDKNKGKNLVVAHTAHPEAWKWQDYFTFNVDHKVIGIQYLVTAFVFYIIGGLMAMAIRVELATPAADFIDPNLYNAFMTNHGTIMILDWLCRCRDTIEAVDDWC